LPAPATSWRIRIEVADTTWAAFSAKMRVPLTMSVLFSVWLALNSDF